MGYMRNKYDWEILEGFDQFEDAEEDFCDYVFNYDNDVPEFGIYKDKSKYL